MQGDVLPGWIGSKLWRGWKAGVLLVLLSLSVYLPGFASTPAVDRDESRFAQASRQMLESGDYIVPRVQGKLRLNKPPLIYWLQAGSAWVFTGGDVSKDAIWMYRVPSLLAAIGVVLVTWRLGASVDGPPAGVLAGAMIAVAPVFWWEARQARADMVLVLCTVIAVAAALRAIAPPSDPATAQDNRPMPWSSAIVLWLAVAAGVMTKGPVTLLVVGLGVLAVCLVQKRWKWVWGLRPLLGLIVVAACVTPWVWAVVREVGWDTWSTTVLDETLGRSLEPKEGHGGFPGYHTLLLPLLLFPGCVFVGVGIWKALGGQPLRGGAFAFSPSPPDLTHTLTKEPPRSGWPPKALLCFIIPTWIVMELVGTKLPHYTMPVYPLLAVLTAGACVIAGSEFRTLMSHPIVRWAVSAWLVAVPLLALIAAAILGFSIERDLTTIVGFLVSGLGVAALFGGVAIWGLRAADWPRVLAAGLLTFALSAAMLGFALPRLDDLWVSRTLARQIRFLDPGARIPIAAVGSDPDKGIVGFHEDSLIFETRGRIQRISPEELATWFRANPTGLAVVPASMLISQGNYIPITDAGGFNYSKGRLVHLCIASVRPGVKP
jgi:4-amino-4-deoxy-L-arabinose transferase-like glycosyltransferase